MTSSFTGKEFPENVTPIQPRTVLEHKVHAGDLVKDSALPLGDAIEAAMRYAVDTFTEGAGVPTERLVDAVSLVARGAVFRALREEREAQLETPPKFPVSQNAFIREVLTFNTAAGRTMDRFDPRATALHTGFQLEELCEKLELGLLAPNFHNMSAETLNLFMLVSYMKTVGTAMKSGAYDPLFDESNPVELLDGDIDVMVVSIGSMMSQGADIFGSCHAVSGANLAKLVNGVAIKDANGKIQKPDGWKPADLEPYLHESKRTPVEVKGVPAWADDLPPAEGSTERYLKD